MPPRARAADNMPSPLTLARVIQRIENWPEVISLRFRLGRRNLSLLTFRDGMSVAVRRQSCDWDVIRDVFLQSGYGRSFDYLRSIGDDETVIDLGANIGSFSLVAAFQNPRLVVEAYEPGPPNIRMFEMNCLANPGLANRIHLHHYAAGGTTRTARWHFDEVNPGGSSLYGRGNGDIVNVRAFSEIVSSVTGPIAMVKIDIEGAEYELVSATPATVWERIPALSIEIHDDPEHKLSKKNLIERFQEFGFRGEPDGQFAVFLHK